MLSRSVQDTTQTPALNSVKKFPWVVAITITLSFLVLIGGLAVAFPKQFVHQIGISIIRQTTPYTQLYFTDPAILPAQLRAGRDSKFAFTIQNSQGKDERYRYTVTMTGAGSSVVVLTGSVAIPNDRSVTYTVSVDPKSHRSRYLINVVLDGTGQSIHFYGDTS